MLNNHAKGFFFTAFFLISALQIWLAWHNQLFGDEAFYWLEGQFPAWSYAELPGWTAWMAALSETVFPHNYFFLRLPHLLVALSIPFLGMAISRLLCTDKEGASVWLSGLLLLSLPLLGNIGIMAIPDIWIVFFTLLSVLLLQKALASNNLWWFILLGLSLAFGVNVHVRFWIVALITGLLTLWIFKSDKQLLRKILFYSLPVMLLGMVPILLFNVYNEFPLMQFQFQDRHPWEFQSNHWYFFPAQIILVTPFVFLLCYQTLRKGLQQAQMPMVRLILLTGLLHWLFYAVFGFFADTQRLNIHWTIVSFCLILVGSQRILKQPSKLTYLSIMTGAGLNMLLLITLVWWLHYDHKASVFSHKIINNSIGWQALANKTRDLMKQHSLSSVVADNFMTAAELAYELGNTKNIQILDHPMNIKHGRAEQIKIINMDFQSRQEKRLVIIEQTALKLQQLTDFYYFACEKNNGLKLIDQLDVKSGHKIFYFFISNHRQCELPPLFYLEQEKGQVSGWIVTRTDQLSSLSLIDNQGQLTELTHKAKPIKQNTKIFEQLDKQKHQIHSFKVETGIQSNYQLKVKLKSSQTFTSKIFFLEN